MRSVDVYEGALVYLDRRPCSDSPDRGRELLFGPEVRSIGLSTHSAGTGDRDSGIVGLLVLVALLGEGNRGGIVGRPDPLRSQSVISKRSIRSP